MLPARRDPSKAWHLTTASVSGLVSRPAGLANRLLEGGGRRRLSEAQGWAKERFSHGSLSYAEVSRHSRSALDRFRCSASQVGRTHIAEPTHQPRTGTRSDTPSDNPLGPARSSIGRCIPSRRGSIGRFRCCAAPGPCLLVEFAPARGSEKALERQLQGAFARNDGWFGCINNGWLVTRMHGMANHCVPRNS